MSLTTNAERIIGATTHLKTREPLIGILRSIPGGWDLEAELGYWERTRALGGNIVTYGVVLKDPDYHPHCNVSKTIRERSLAKLSEIEKGTKLPDVVDIRKPYNPYDTKFRGNSPLVLDMKREIALEYLSGRDYGGKIEIFSGESHLESPETVTLDVDISLGVRGGKLENVYDPLFWIDALVHLDKGGKKENLDWLMDALQSFGIPNGRNSLILVEGDKVSYL